MDEKTYVHVDSDGPPNWSGHFGLAWEKATKTPPSNIRRPGSKTRSVFPWSRPSRWVPDHATQTRARLFLERSATLPPIAGAAFSCAARSAD